LASLARAEIIGTESAHHARRSRGSIAIGGEIYGVVQLLEGKFSAAMQGANLSAAGSAFLIGIAVFAIIGSFLWKRANEKDPASRG
jgi:hypothetical protein